MFSDPAVEEIYCGHGWRNPLIAVCDVLQQCLRRHPEFTPVTWRFFCLSAGGFGRPYLAAMKLGCSWLLFERFAIPRQKVLLGVSTDEVVSLADSKRWSLDLLHQLLEAMS